MAASKHPSRQEYRPDTYEDDGDDLATTLTFILVAFLAILTLIAQAV